MILLDLRDLRLEAKRCGPGSDGGSDGPADGVGAGAATGEAFGEAETLATAAAARAGMAPERFVAGCGPGLRMRRLALLRAPVPEASWRVRPYPTTRWSLPNPLPP